MSDSVANSVQTDSTCWNSNIWVTLNEVGETVARVAYLIFQSFIHLVTFQFGAIRWDFKNYSHFQKTPAFILSSPPFYSLNQSYPDAFNELREEYKKLNSLKDDKAFKSHINRVLLNGFCHASCLGLVQLIQKNKYSLKEAISDLKSLETELTMRQILEVFRANSQVHNREDQMKKVTALGLVGLEGEKEGCVNEDNFRTELRGCLENKTASVVVRLYNNTGGHSIILDLDSSANSYSFYNSNAACYEYEDFESFFTALLEHVESYTDYLKKDPDTFWELAFYPHQTA